jgi:hypothetical protein
MATLENITPRVDLSNNVLSSFFAGFINFKPRVLPGVTGYRVGYYPSRMRNLPVDMAFPSPTAYRFAAE